MDLSSDAQHDDDLLRRETEARRKRDQLAPGESEFDTFLEKHVWNNPDLGSDKKIGVAGPGFIADMERFKFEQETIQLNLFRFWSKWFWIGWYRKTVWSWWYDLHEKYLK
jgi:hypothetical protein